MGCALGVDIGGTKLLAVLLDEERGVVERLRLATGRAAGPAQVVGLVAEVVETLRGRGADFAGIGIGFPGLVDTQRGLVRSSVMLDGWAEVPLGRLLAEQVGVPCAVDND